jgi:hypothetical protein
MVSSVSVSTHAREFRRFGAECIAAMAGRLTQDVAKDVAKEMSENDALAGGSTGLRTIAYTV